MRSLLVRSLVAALVSCLLRVSVAQLPPTGCQTIYDNFNNPYDVATDSNGNIYVADNGGQRVFQTGSQGGAVTQTYQTTNPALSNPDGLCLDSSNNVYVVDSGNNRVLKFSNNGQLASQYGIFATNSTTTPGLAYPWSCAVDNTNGFLYVSNTVGQGITKLSLATGSQTASYTTTSPSFAYPNQVAVDSAGNVYAADSNNFRVVKFNTAGSQVATFNLPGGSYPNGVAVDSNGTVYVTDTVNGRVVVFSANGANPFNITTTNPPMSSPRGIWVDSSYNIFITDSGNKRIVKLFSQSSGNTNNPNCAQAPSSASVNGYGVSSLYPSSGNSFNNPYDLVFDSSNSLYVADTGNNRVVKLTTGGTVQQIYTATGTALSSPNGVCLDSSNNVYVVDTNNQRVVSFANGGNQMNVIPGTTFTPNLNYPWNCAFDQSGLLYVSNTVGQVISVLNQTNNVQVGADNVGAVYPNQIAIDSANNLYVADSNRFRVTKFSIATLLATPSSSVATPLTTFTLPNGSYPNGVALDTSGNLYVSDTTNNTIVQFNPTGTITQIFALPGTTEALNNPRGMAISSGGDIYVADSSNSRIVKFSKSGNSAASAAQTSSVLVVALVALLSLFFSL